MRIDYYITYELSTHIVLLLIAAIGLCITKCTAMVLISSTRFWWHQLSSKTDSLITNVTVILHMRRITILLYTGFNPSFATIFFTNFMPIRSPELLTTLRLSDHPPASTTIWWSLIEWLPLHLAFLCSFHLIQPISWKISRCDLLPNPHAFSDLDMLSYGDRDGLLFDLCDRFDLHADLEQRLKQTTDLEDHPTCSLGNRQRSSCGQ